MSDVKTENNINEVEGNLLTFDADFIAHQCNCVSTKSLGLSASMFKVYPNANIYKERVSGLRHIPGTIVVRKSSSSSSSSTDNSKPKYVINMMGQYYPGKCRGEDTYSKRLEWFQKCLKCIDQLPIQGKSIAFPCNIGCGLAGGKWKDYEKILKDWAQTVDMTVYIVKLRNI